MGKKRFLALCILLPVLLSGCGGAKTLEEPVDGHSPALGYGPTPVPAGEVTAEGLIRGAFGKGGAGSMEMQMSLSVANRQDMTAEYGEGAVVTTEFLSDIDAVYTAAASHTTGKYSFSVSGFGTAGDLESYCDYGEGVTYTADNGWTVDGNPVWTYEEQADSLGCIADGFPEGVFRDAVLAGSTAVDGTYEVSAKLPYSGLADILGGTGMLGIDKSLDGRILFDLDVSMLFWEDTKLIKEFKAQGADGPIEFSLTLYWGSIGEGLFVEIPAEVVSGAVPAVQHDTGSLKSTPKPLQPVAPSAGSTGVLSSILPYDVGCVAGVPAENLPAGTFGEYYGYLAVPGRGVPVRGFLDDGWVLGGADGTAAYIENEKYPGVLLWAEGYSPEAGLDAMMEKGIYRIEVSAVHASGECLPDIRFCGITFGSAEEDVLLVYGEPSSESDTGMYRVLCYDFDNFNRLEFYITDGKVSGFCYVDYQGIWDSDYNAVG